MEQRVADLVSTNEEMERELRLEVRGRKALERELLELDELLRNAEKGCEFCGGQKGLVKGNGRNGSIASFTSEDEPEPDNTLSSSSSSSSCSPSSNPNQETTHLKTTLATLSQTITQLTTRLETLEQDKHRREMAEKNFIQNTTVNPPPPLSSSGNRNSLRVLTTPPRVSSPLVVRNPFLRGGLGEEEDGKGIRSA